MLSFHGARPVGHRSGQEESKAGEGRVPQGRPVLVIGPPCSSPSSPLGMQAAPWAWLWLAPSQHPLLPACCSHARGLCTGGQSLQAPSPGLPWTLAWAPAPRVQGPELPLCRGVGYGVQPLCSGGVRTGQVLGGPGRGSPCPVSGGSWPGSELEPLHRGPAPLALLPVGWGLCLLGRRG